MVHRTKSAANEGSERAADWCTFIPAFVRSGGDEGERKWEGRGRRREEIESEEKNRSWGVG